MKRSELVKILNDMPDVEVVCTCEKTVGENDEYVEAYEIDGNVFVDTLNQKWGIQFRRHPGSEVQAIVIQC